MRRAGRLVHEGAAAGREHFLPLGQQPRDHFALAFAKIGLAETFEYFRHGHLRAGLDLGVGVDKGQIEMRGEAPADGSLARPHHADEHDGAPAESGDQGAAIRSPNSS